ncbi:hypothetical protein GCM10009623_15700 [Nocardioides aestuarii]|uniref:Secreted protein n=1 Tax=Nocardioides aestuarii TaxID=252231 RepID=A0ABW4TK01_9ACTN
MSTTTRHTARHTARAATALAAVALATACSAAATEARPAAPPQPAVAATPAGTYDGWAVRVQWDVTTPSTCGWSPDQVERLLEADAPLPPCLDRLQRWFSRHYPAQR